MKDIGLIFDMDGVIVDNHEYHYKSWQIVAAKHGAEIDETFYREKMNGRTLSKLMNVVFPNKSMTSSEARIIGLEKEAIYRELYHDYRKPTKGLLSFLQLAQSKSIPMVVGTSAPKENVEFTLDGLEIRSYFKGVVDDQMVMHGKPDPEVYLKCSKMIQRDPQDCIVFEDALSGIQAAKSAGSRVIALATSHERNELNADLIIDDFSELTWEQIMEVLSH